MSNRYSVPAMNRSLSGDMSRNSPVGIATGYGLNGPRFDSRQGVWNFLYSTVSGAAPGHIQSHIQWVGGAVFLGVKRTGREADHSSPSSAGVKNAGAIPPLPNTSSWRGAKLIKHRHFYYV
jgi:hypothetical protein